MTPAAVARAVSVGECEIDGRRPDHSPSNAFARPKSRSLTLPSSDTTDVRGLEVAMDDALLVGRLQRLGDLARQRKSLFEWKRPRRDLPVEAFALGELHDEEVPPGDFFE